MEEMNDEDEIEYNQDEIDAKLTEALTQRPILNASMIKTYSICKDSGEGTSPFRRIPDDMLSIIRSNHYVINTVCWLQFSRNNSIPLRGRPEYYGVYQFDSVDEDGLQMISYKFNDSGEAYVPAKNISFSLPEAKNFITDHLMICVVLKEGVVQDFFYIY